MYRIQETYSVTESYPCKIQYLLDNPAFLEHSTCKFSFLVTVCALGSPVVPALALLDARIQDCARYSLNIYVELGSTYYAYLGTST
jgi:hypothetical protein